MRRIFKSSNVPVLLVCLIHISAIYAIATALIQDPLIGVPIAMVIYAILILLIISPVGEWLFRICCGGRCITRQDWQQKLDMISSNLIANAQAQDRNIPSNIRFYYVNDPFPSAFSIGKHTICITSGLLEMNESNIRACVAHELGHISSYDSTVLLIANAGNGIVALLGALFQSFYLFNNLISRYIRSSKMAFMNFLHTVLSLIPLGIVMLVLWTSRLILNIGSRQKEYEADEYAIRLGEGSNLRNTLLAIDIESQIQRRTIWRMLVASHPSVYDRVGRIDGLLNFSQQSGTLVRCRRGMANFSQSIDENDTSLYDVLNS